LGNLQGRHTSKGGTNSFFFQQLGVGFGGKWSWGILNGNENDETALNKIKALQITKMPWLTSEWLGRQLNVAVTGR